MAIREDIIELAPRIARRRTVYPGRMSEPEIAALSAQLYAVHSLIFDGSTAEGFRAHVVEPAAEDTRIQLFLDDDGAVIGYCALHLFRRKVLGRESLVLRAEAGLCPDYRGRSMTYGIGIARAAEVKLRHPFTPFYYLGTLVHTSSYHLFCKYFPQIFPHHSRDDPPRLRQIAQELIESFDDPAVSEHDPFVRDVGWVTIETNAEKSLNRRGDRSDVRFFKARNPGYPQGHGLVVVVPLTVANTTAALLALVAELGLHAFGRRLPEL